MRKVKDKYILIYSRITNNGEFGLWPTNYTLAYCYSTSPLGPFTYGGTIIDGRGKELQPDGSFRATATYYGNTHGSILEVNGQWYVFYHRQAGTTEFSRQAMVAPITVEVEEDRVDEYQYRKPSTRLRVLNLTALTRFANTQLGLRAAIQTRWLCIRSTQI